MPQSLSCQSGVRYPPDEVKTEMSLLDIKEAPSAGQGNISVYKGLLTQIKMAAASPFPPSQQK